MDERTAQPTIIPAHGVSAPGFDSYLLTDHLLTRVPGRLLDMGTGTGYVAIMAARAGWNPVAADITEAACDCASANAERNNVSFEIIRSDLFENVTGVFDCIAFNPPYGSASSGSASALLEKVKALIPRNNALVAEAAFLLIRAQRKKLIMRFLESAGAYLNDNGRVLLLLHRSEVDPVLTRFPGSVVGESRWMRLVSIPAPSL